MYLSLTCGYDNIIFIIRGEKVEDVCKTMTVEGVPTAKVAVEFANRCGLDLPIFTAVDLILSGKLQIEDAHLHLMGRVPGMEFKRVQHN